ncbi:MAG: protein kinase [Candidatus Brocadiae bacterium]|nr:protein kinase [Candidatus Brocadiia bacterium]
MATVALCLSCSKPLPEGSGEMVCDRCWDKFPRQSTVSTGTAFGEAAPSAAAEEAPLPPEIGGHRVEGVLGRGGMGVVYSAVEPILQRRVALKVLLPGASGVEQVERLLAESIVTGRLSHPGIVPIYRVGRDEVHGPWYTMKPVEGRSLAEILTGLRDGVESDVDRYRLPTLLRIFLAACEAVAFAHRARVVHRDLKPANIMVGEFGVVMVLDWGLARVLDAAGASERLAVPAADSMGIEVAEDRKFSRAGAVMGTLGYMSPEQARGEGGAAGPPSDVYALGAILYQILTLRLPVDGRVGDQLTRTIQGRIVPIAKRPQGRSAPKALAAAVTKALSLQPDKRHPTALELAREVEAWLEGAAPWTRQKEGWQPKGTTWRAGTDELEFAGGAEGVVFHRAAIPGDARVRATVEGSRRRPGWRLDIRVACSTPLTDDGYVFRVVAGEDAAVEFWRAGVLLERSGEITLDPHTPHEIEVRREGDLLLFRIDGARHVEFHDLFPLRGPALVLAPGDSPLRIPAVVVETHGVPLQVDFTALPDRLMEMGQVRDARALYLRLAESHPERAEGLVARYKAALCASEIGDRTAALAELKTLHQTTHEALAPLGRAKVAMRHGDVEGAWKELSEACAQFRNDPVRVDLWTELLSLARRAETGDGAKGRELYSRLLTLPWLTPRDVAQVCSALLRLASAGGGTAKMRDEALALLTAHPTQTSLRMELHAALSRMGGTDATWSAIRAALQKTLDLTDQITRADRARLLLWLIESCLGAGEIAAAEKWLTNAFSSVSHPSTAGLWARNWRALVAIVQKKWEIARKTLSLHASLYRSGTAGPHFLGALLEALAESSGGPGIRDRLRDLATRAPDWAPLAPALSGDAPTIAFLDWVATQPRAARCGLLLAGACALEARGDAPGAEFLRGRAAKEAEGRAIAVWAGGGKEKGR